MEETLCPDCRTLLERIVQLEVQNAEQTRQFETATRQWEDTSRQRKDMTRQREESYSAAGRGFRAGK